MDTQGTSASEIVRTLSVPDIRQRLDEIDAESKALRVLLRAARARQSANPPADEEAGAQ